MAAKVLVLKYFVLNSNIHITQTHRYTQIICITHACMLELRHPTGMHTTRHISVNPCIYQMHILDLEWETDACMYTFIYTGIIPSAPEFSSNANIS